MGKYSLIIFDYDGTLVDSAPWMRTAVNRAAEKFSFRKVTEDEIDMLRGKDNREIVRYLEVPLWKLPLIATFIRKLAAAEASQIPLFPGVLEMLDRLHTGGVTLIVATSNSEENVRRALGSKTASLIRYYETGIGLFGKASRYKDILKKSRVPAPSVIAIGDEARDIEAARSAGIASGAVTWGYASTDLLEACKPTEIFHSIDDIPARILE